MIFMFFMISGIFLFLAHMWQSLDVLETLLISRKGLTAGKPRDYCSCVLQETVGILNSSNTTLKIVRKMCKKTQRCSSGEWWFWWLWTPGTKRRSWYYEWAAFSVPAQDEHHGAAGPEHEPHTGDIMECWQCCRQWLEVLFRMNSRQEFKILQACDVLFAPYSSHICNNIYKQVQNPAQVYGGANVPESFSFKLWTAPVLRDNLGVLEDTQEGGAANGQNPDHPIKTEKQIASNSLRENFTPKSATLWGNISTQVS